MGGAVELVFLSSSGDFSEESNESLLYKKELCRWKSCVLKYLKWLGFFCLIKTPGLTSNQMLSVNKQMM